MSIVLEDIPETDIPADHDYSLITTEEQLDALIRRMQDAELIAVDTETEGIHHDDVIVGICISVGPRHGAYIPIRHEQDGMAGFAVRYPNQLDPTLVFSKLGPLLEEKPLTGHNTKFDYKMFYKEGIIANFVHDTLIIAAVSGRYDQGRRGLKELINLHFGHEMTELSAFFKPEGRKRKPEIRPKILSPDMIMQYGCEDADYSFRLLEYLNPLVKEGKLLRIYNVEMRLMRVVAEMELCGVPSSHHFLQSKADEAGILLERMERELVSEIRDAAGDPELEINFNSPKQLGELIFDKLNIPYTGELTASGARSTAGHIMEALAKDYPVIERIHTFRLLKKLKGTFLQKMADRVQADGRIRGNFNQAGTASGRFSSSDPNLQNIPKDQTFALWAADHTLESEALAAFPETLRRAEDGETWEAYSDEADRWGNYYLGINEETGRHFMVNHGQVWQAWRCPTRQFITASEGNYIVEADYSQIELRVMAGESREPSLLEAYATGDDVHTKTASVLFGVPFENVTKVQRSIGKTINFGLLYGAGPQRISQELGISLQEAKEIVQRYFENLPMIKSWINRMKKDAKEDGYADTAFGRRRYFPNIRSRHDHGLVAREEREAVNHHIQGAAADVMKLSLIRIHNRMKKHYGNKVSLMCTVHDSVILEVDNSIPFGEVALVLREAMEFNPSRNGDRVLNGFAGPWPDLAVDMGYGPSWAECSDLSVPEGQEAPAELDDIPTFRPNLLVGRHREGDMDGSQLGFVEVEALPEEEVVEEEPQETSVLDTETGELLDEEPQHDIHWFLTIPTKPEPPQVVKLRDFLAARKDENGRNSLTMKFPVDGVMQPRPIKGRFNLDFEDEMNMRLIFGNCKLRQDANHFNVDAVLG